ncbi:MFS transporter [Frigidibacter sp. MR17.24]|uniref:MFS transporter n=1 Tax=Frigidibacter sp. MR17.24 TaxID=3127345 RepID=UPI0030130159
MTDAMTDATSACPGPRAPSTPPVLTRGLVLLLATACGMIAANLYYAQPLVAPIAAEFAISPALAGLIVTMCQLGYGLGLLFLVPVADLVENRRLILSILALGTVALVGAALAGSAASFLTAALLIGLGSVSVQVIVPYAAALAPEEMRGQVVGSVLSGLMTGIMLARPVSSFLADAFGWRAVFWVSAVALVALAAVIRARMPARVPPAGMGYAGLLASMRRLALGEPVLQRRTLCHALLFAAFSLFWTVVPLHLAQDFGLSQSGIALFALAGAAGAVAAPIGGRLADRGHGTAAVIAACLLGIGCFVAGFAAEGPSGAWIAVLVLAGIALDFGVALNLVVSQRALFALGAEMRGRLNGLFMAGFFAGGAAGSAVGGWAWAVGGWPLASAIGAALPAAALAAFLAFRAAGARD